MERRTRLEVLGSILETCGREGASKTRIVYQTNLNFKNAGAYTKWLREKGYIAQKGKLYLITPSGEELLISLKEICTILNIDSPKEEDSN